MKRIGILSFALSAMLAAGCWSGKGKDLGQANNSEPATVGTSGAVEIASQDARDFIHYVAIVNLAEIDLGKLAAERGAMAEVKKFGQMMVADHTASGDKLGVLASDLKIEAPGQLDDKHKELRDKLSKPQGADFDREYVSAMIEGHKDLIDQLEPRLDKKTLGTAAILPDPSNNPTTMRINQFAAGIYPVVYAHLEAARALESSIKKRHTTP